MGTQSETELGFTGDFYQVSCVSYDSTPSRLMQVPSVPVLPVEVIPSSMGYYEDFFQQNASPLHAYVAPYSALPVVYLAPQVLMPENSFDSHGFATPFSDYSDPSSVINSASSEQSFKDGVDLVGQKPSDASEASDTNDYHRVSSDEESHWELRRSRTHFFCSCGKRYRQQSGLSRHRGEFKGQRRSCNIYGCEFTAKRADTLKRHREKCQPSKVQSRKCRGTSS